MPFSPQRNLYALYVIKIAKWMNLVMPVVVLFYHSNGLGMQDIFLLQSTYSVTLMLLEIPTGYFADKVGRRTSIILGSSLGFAGYGIYVFSFGFWQFVAAEVVLGISQSLVSGADSALLYDSLKAASRTDSYSRLEGRITSIGNFGEALAGIIGGLLAALSLRTPFYFQAIIAFMALPAALALVEPPVNTMAKPSSFKEIRRIMHEVFLSNIKLKWNTLFSAFTGAATLTMAWFAQPYFATIGFPTAWYGVVWALLNGTVGLAALYAWKIEGRLGVTRTVAAFTAMIIGCYLLLLVLPGYTGMLVLFAFYFARGTATPLLRNYIQCITVSEVRATVLSVRNFLIRFIFAVTGPILGWAVDQQGLKFALIAAGMFFGVFILLSLHNFLKYKTYQP